MKLIKADHNRRIEIAGVSTPVRRPVDIDQSKTGFANLRTLRIYQFDPESVIDGHAEEDEVLIIVLAGAVELTMTTQESGGAPIILIAPGDSRSTACAAYLPPHAAYRLVAQQQADVAYVRATPVGSRPPRIFNRAGLPGSGRVSVLLDESTYAEKLRIRLVQLNARNGEVSFSPIGDSESGFEALVHVSSARGSKGSISIGENVMIPAEAWDTAAVPPGEHPIVHVPAGSSVLLLIALAYEP